MQQSRVKIKFHIFHVIIIKVSHNNVNVVICISMLKVTSTVVFVGLRTFTTGEECTVSLSLFADPGANLEKVLRIRGGATQAYHHNQ